MPTWENQSPTMKRIWIVMAFVTAFVIIHGTWTYRMNHQRAFAVAVEKRIDITTIHVRLASGVMVLVGHASKPQSLYAEEIARMFLVRYAPKAVNPPSDLRNEIQIDSKPVTRNEALDAARGVASEAESH